MSTPLFLSGVSVTKRPEENSLRGLLWTLLPTGNHSAGRLALCPMRRHQPFSSGAAQMGVSQRRNFNALPGVQMLEPLPDLPGVRFLMVAGVLANAREPNRALAFAKFLASPSAAAVIKAKGMEPYAP
jgi:ABC-type molybdate transport system substrate-binding protein